MSIHARIASLPIYIAVHPGFASTHQCYCIIVNIDSAIRIYSTVPPQELSVLDDPKEGGKSGRTRGQNPNAGWYNRFVQTGKSDHETKSNGCFGGPPRFTLCCTQSVIDVIAPHALLLGLPGCIQSPHVRHIHIHAHTAWLHQDLASRPSAARSPATCIRPHASSGCRGSVATPAAWPRYSHSHCLLCVSPLLVMVYPPPPAVCQLFHTPSLVPVHYILSVVVSACTHS